MALPTNETPFYGAISFRDSHWTTRWLLVGLAFLFLGVPPHDLFPIGFLKSPGGCCWL